MFPVEDFGKSGATLRPGQPTSPVPTKSSTVFMEVLGARPAWSATAPRISA
jgi:hypothetical protein